jgi:hypothetical protein
MHSEYTTNAKLISRGSKMVNVVATCHRTMRSRVMLGHNAPTGSGREEVRMLLEKAAIGSGGYAAEFILIVATPKSP